MALASSGTLSIGGSTSGRSINLELNRSATATSSLGESALRTLAGVSSGAISMSNFYGASNALDTQTVTVGNRYMNIYGNIINYWGKFGSYGSISDGTCNFKSGASIYGAYYYSNSGTNASQVGFILVGTYTNAGFTTMKVGSYQYSRSSAIFSQNSGNTYWIWNTSANPYGTTTNVNKTVIWT